MSEPNSPFAGIVQKSNERQDVVVDSRISKRKRSSKLKTSERKKVSRACDACKEKKVRCAGTQPCSRCITNDLECHYDTEHRRGNPAPPQPATLFRSSELPASTPESRSSRHQLDKAVIIRHSSSTLPPEGPQSPPQIWQEVDENRYENNYIGPTSGLAFLSRSQRRFQQDFIESRSGNSERSSQTSIFSFGDGLFSDNHPDFNFPSRSETKYLLQQYFDFAMPTYRFLHRETAETWLENIHSAIESGNSGPVPVANARNAIVILILATAKLYNGDDLETDLATSSIYYVAAERVLQKETGKVTLESVQARLSQCIYLLASSRVNQAWYVFGTTTQLIIALGLHRRQVHHPSSSPQSSIIHEYRKRVFWSAYTLDRYLSVILGRPRIFRDEDIDQPLADQSDSDAASTYKTGTKSRYVQSVDDGPIFHARLAKIIGGISGDLYPTSRSEDRAWLQSAEQWTAELKSWKESLPAFLDPSKVDPSMLISIFQRQSTVLRLAYAHALILANRPSLLSDFADLAKRTELLMEEPSTSLKECVKAAMIVVDTVTELIEEKKMRQSFWFTHYISFCAISALYVYTIQQCLPHPAAPQSRFVVRPDTQMFEAAQRCQQKIEETTTKASPFRKYNIILDELKKEVLQHLGSQHAETTGLQTPTGEQRIGNMQSAVLGTQTLSLTQDLQHLSAGQLGTYADQFPPPAVAPATDTPQNPILHPAPSQYYASSQLGMNGDQMYDISSGDLSFLGMQGGSLGWSEFDSCALTWPDVYGGLEQGYEM